jgi:hypothetical protein
MNQLHIQIETRIFQYKSKQKEYDSISVSELMRICTHNTVASRVGCRVVVEGQIGFFIMGGGVVLVDFKY